MLLYTNSFYYNRMTFNRHTRHWSFRKSLQSWRVSQCPPIYDVNSCLSNRFTKQERLVNTSCSAPTRLLPKPHSLHTTSRPPLLCHTHWLILLSAGLHKRGTSDGRAKEDFDWDTAANDCPTSRTAQAGHRRDCQAVYDTKTFKFQNLASDLNGTLTQIVSVMSRTDKMSIWYHVLPDSCLYAVETVIFFGILSAAGMRNWNGKLKRKRLASLCLLRPATSGTPEPVVSFKLFGV